MNKRVTLQRTPKEDNTSGFEDLSPSQVWAYIQPLGAIGERLHQHKVVIRYHPEVTIDSRIVYGDRALYVRSVQNIDEENVSMELLCEEVAL